MVLSGTPTAVDFVGSKLYWTDPQDNLLALNDFTELSFADKLPIEPGYREYMETFCNIN